MTMSDKERIKELNEMIDTILIAISQEVKANRLYLEMGNKAKSESSKKMFNYLAMQEKLHENKLKLLLKRFYKEREDLGKK